MHTHYLMHEYIYSTFLYQAMCGICLNPHVTVEVRGAAGDDSRTKGEQWSGTVNELG